MIWITRPAEARVAALLAGGARVTTVQGLGGTGTSGVVAHALAHRRHRRIDASSGLTPSVRAQLTAPSAPGVVTFLDQVRDPEPFRSLVVRAAPVIVAARRPFDLDVEHRVPLGMLDEASTRELLSAELLRLGAANAGPTAALLGAVDGWPLAALAVTRHVRTFGLEDEDFDVVVSRDPACAAAARGVWSSLGKSARALAVVLAVTGAPIPLREAARSVSASACAELDASGILVPVQHGIRLVRGFASFVRRTAPEAAIQRARTRRTAAVLRTAEAASAKFRRDPRRSGAVLRELEGELWALALDSDQHPRTIVRAALALEPIAVGKLERERVLALGAAAMRAAERVGRRARNAVRLAHVRALIARGDHESADALLTEPELARDPTFAVRTAIHRAHVAAWRDDLERADDLLTEAARRLGQSSAAKGAAVDAHEDLLVQRTFVAFRRGDLDATERLARACVAGGRRRPSPRVVTMARRFVAEARLARGDARAALALFERTRSELEELGDDAGALFLGTRIAAALERIGDAAGATVEAHAVARAAAQAGEPAFEVPTLDARSDALARGRVEELAWRAQIPSLRAEAERWLARNDVRDAGPMLRVDLRARRAAYGTKTIDLARRTTLWSILRALIEAHGRLEVLDAEALFRVGWPGDRASRASRRKRVQTAIWALRRALLADALASRPDGYALESRIGIAIAPHRA